MAITCNQMVLSVIFELCKLVQTCAVGKRSTIFGCQCKRYQVVCLLSFGLALPQLMNVHSVTQFVHRIFSRRCHQVHQEVSNCWRETYIWTSNDYFLTHSNSLRTVQILIQCGLFQLTVSQSVPQIHYNNIIPKSLSTQESNRQTKKKTPLLINNNSLFFLTFFSFYFSVLYSILLITF